MAVKWLDRESDDGANRFFFLLWDTVQPSDLSMHMEGYKSKLGCPEDLFKQFIQYYALVYKGWWCNILFALIFPAFTPHHITPQKHTTAWTNTRMCSVDYCFKSVSRGVSMYIHSSENLDDCFCGWHLSGYIALMNVTNHSCQHNTFDMINVHISRVSERCGWVSEERLAVPSAGL